MKLIAHAAHTTICAQMAGDEQISRSVWIVGVCKEKEEKKKHRNLLY